jgi:methionyl-tRNA formyltransferase
MIYVLTYNHPHRKTQDLLLKLKLKGYEDITVLSTPWQDRKNFVPLIPHRFLPPDTIYPKELCLSLKFNYIELKSYHDVPKLETNDLVLIGGAGIIPKELTDTNKIINSHPAYLPYVRGLDALKWAIYDGLPLGVTSHIISSEVDLGILIKREMLPLYYWDTFHSVACRQYELEINMLANSIEDLYKNPQIPVEDLEEIQLPIPRKRMPHKCEIRLIDKFNKRIDNVI